MRRQMQASNNKKFKDVIRGVVGVTCSQRSLGCTKAVKSRQMEERRRAVKSTLI